MADTLTPVERTNWALSTWNSTLDRNDAPSAWLYGQDHLVGNSGPRVFTWGALASSHPTPSLPYPPPTHPPPSYSGLKLVHTIEKSSEKA